MGPWRQGFTGGKSDMAVEAADSWNRSLGFGSHAEIFRDGVATFQMVYPMWGPMSSPGTGRKRGWPPGSAGRSVCSGRKGLLSAWEEPQQLVPPHSQAEAPTHNLRKIKESL